MHQHGKNSAFQLRRGKKSSFIAAVAAGYRDDFSEFRSCLGIGVLSENAGREQQQNRWLGSDGTTVSDDPLVAQVVVRLRRLASHGLRAAVGR